MELTKSIENVKEKCVFFKSYNIYKTQKSQFWLSVLLCIRISLYRIVKTGNPDTETWTVSWIIIYVLLSLSPSPGSIPFLNPGSLYLLLLLPPPPYLSPGSLFWLLLLRPLPIYPLTPFYGFFLLPLPPIYIMAAYHYLLAPFSCSFSCLLPLTYPLAPYSGSCSWEQPQIPGKPGWCLQWPPGWERNIWYSSFSSFSSCIFCFSWFSSCSSSFFCSSSSSPPSPLPPWPDSKGREPLPEPEVPGAGSQHLDRLVTHWPSISPSPPLTLLERSVLKISPTALPTDLAPILQWTVLQWATPYCTVLHRTALHCTAPHCTALHCTALHCTALHYTALYCTVLRRKSINFQVGDQKVAKFCWFFPC